LLIIIAAENCARFNEPREECGDLGEQRKINDGDMIFKGQ
jgi:hypothetical protein